MSTAELLEQWREATRAAELAARLAKMAAESLERSTRGALAAAELAELTDRAAIAATEAAATARKAANDAVSLAARNAEEHDREIATLHAAQGNEQGAQVRYHDAEREAADRHNGDGA